ARKGRNAWPWTTRLLTASRPWVRWSSARSVSCCSRMAVELIATAPPSTIAMSHAMPSRWPKSANTPAVAMTWAAPSPSTSRRMASMPGSENSSPSWNSRNATPSSASSRVLDCEAAVARLRLRAQASRDGVEEAAHERHVRVADVQLLLDAVDGFDQILLIAARKSHARYGMLYGNQRLVYCGLFRPIHGSKFEPVCEKPQAPHCPRRQTAGPKNKSPAFARRGSVT